MAYPCGVGQNDSGQCGQSGNGGAGHGWATGGSHDSALILRSRTSSVGVTKAVSNEPPGKVECAEA